MMLEPLRVLRSQIDQTLVLLERLGVNRRWNGTPDRRVIGPPRPDGCSSVERAVLSPLGGARAGSERAPRTLASGRRGRGLWTPVG